LLPSPNSNDVRKLLPYSTVQCHLLVEKVRISKHLESFGYQAKEKCVAAEIELTRHEIVLFVGQWCEVYSIH